MSFGLGFWANTAGDGGGAGAYEQIATAFGTGSSGTITFSSIDQSYKHLQIRATVRPTTSISMNMRMNGVTSSSYAWHALRGTGAAVQSQGGTGQDNIQLGETLSGAANMAAPHIIDILDYTNTSKNKTVRSMYGNPVTDFFVGMTSGVLLSTSAVTSLTFFLPVYNFTSASRFTLYGIKG